MVFVADVIKELLMKKRLNKIVNKIAHSEWHDKGNSLMQVCGTNIILLIFMKDIYLLTIPSNP